MNTAEMVQLTPIGHIQNDFKEKFGIPRQSLLTRDLISRIVMEPDFRSPDAFRGIESFDYLWLLWIFSENIRSGFHATVRPPKLNGNTRMGVFATGSPFRPNPIGLSCVKLVRLDQDNDCGPILYVAGADLMDGTPIVDIKPYLPYTDSHEEAKAGFTDNHYPSLLNIVEDCALPEGMTELQKKALYEALAQDPRPGYQHDPERIYGFAYGQWNVRFKVGADGLHIVEVEG